LSGFINERKATWVFDVIQTEQQQQQQQQQQHG